MKFLIVFALAFATVTAKDLYSHSIEVPVLKNEGRITNGLNAEPGQFPYQVGISLKSGANSFWCGGSLIDETWILSAAQCTYKVSLVTVYLGATQRLAAEKAYNVTESGIFTHPNFNPTTLKTDISLIRIPAAYGSSRIGFTQIPSNDDDYVRDSVVIAGWGRINDNTKALSNNLQYAILTVSPGSVCSAVYHRLFSEATEICVASLNHVSTCVGDTGGPLVLEDENLQIGLVSHANNVGCAKGLPIVFTRISTYRLWIKALTGVLIK